MTSKPELSAIKPIADGRKYVFRVDLTSDEPEKVQRFYEKRVHHQLMSTSSEVRP